MKADNQPEEPEQLVVADAPTLDTELHPGWNWAKPEHIPEPTYWPVALALATTLIAWGTITTPLLFIPGIVVFAVALAGWIGDLIRDQRAH